jgi:hypothetical protein
MRQHRAKSKCTSTLPPMARLPSPLAPSTSKCPLCTSSPLSLLQHLQSAHRDHTWTSIELQPWGLVACTCGAAVLNRAALPGHRFRSKCSAWQDTQDRTQASIRPFANTSNRTGSSPTPLINTPTRSSPTRTSSSPTRTSSHRSSSTQPSSDSNRIGIPHIPSINTHTRLTTRLSSSTTSSIVPHHSGIPPRPQDHADDTSTPSDTPCNHYLDSLPSSPSPDFTTTPITSSIDSSWQPGTPVSTPPPGPPLSPPPASIQPPHTSPHDRFLQLASLPTTTKPISGSIAASFGEAAERLARAFIQHPSDRTLLDFLALPKVGLTPALRSREDAKDRLEAYPLVAWPVPQLTEGQVPLPEDRQIDPMQSIQKQIEHGKLSRAARMLTDDSSVMQVTPEVIQSLQDKHPRGDPCQAFGSSPGPSPAPLPADSTILQALGSFKRDTAPGISGWTHHLLTLALKRPLVLEMVHTLVGLVLQGSAPGQSMLCTSRLTPLAKPDGGIRPIAVGELLYRLVVKVILRHTARPDMLLPFQFGVGSTGGVEPMIRAIQQTVDRAPGYTFTQLTSLDFKNAFNTLDRADLATGLRRFAPGLYRAARWAYGSTTDLVLTGNLGQQHLLLSSQGVRQGDPFGPLFFSLGIRTLLDRLSAHLGPHRLILAYLDDVYILSHDSQVLADVSSFFDNQAASLRLNLAKSSTHTIQDITQSGLNVLGSCVGSQAPRAAFLQAKIEEQERTLAKLPGLPHQHALLVLRECLQQNLRHLLRSLRSDDLGYLWTRYDHSLQRCVLQMQGANLAPQGDGLDAPETLLNGLIPVQAQPDHPGPSEHLESVQVDHTNWTGPCRTLPGPFLENSTFTPSNDSSHAPETLQDDPIPVQGQPDHPGPSEHLESVQVDHTNWTGPCRTLPGPFLENSTFTPPCDSSHAPETLQDDPIPVQGQPDHPGPSEHLESARVHQASPSRPCRTLPGPFLENSTFTPSNDSSHAPEASLHTYHKAHQLISLPAKLGGLGILSMLECAPHAYAASSEASDRTLQPLLLSQPSEQLLDDTDTPDKTPIRSQKERCTQAFEARHRDLLLTLSSAEAQAVQESATYLGRRWLSIIPFHPSLKLSDFELSAALHHRTLCPSKRAYCQHCGSRNEIMHDEVCPARPKWRIARHELLKHTLADALTRSPSLGKVRVEPFVPGSHLRTDISISGSQANGTGPQEFDITIVSLASSQFRSTDPNKNTLQQVLSRAAQAKNTKYASSTASKFVPLVFSLGGGMETQCSSTLQSWRDHMPFGTHSFLLRRISILLLRARFRFFEG